jgi:hypothetical protein
MTANGYWRLQDAAAGLRGVYRAFSAPDVLSGSSFLSEGL